jgi:hypothetical protein
MGLVATLGRAIVGRMILGYTKQHILNRLHRYIIQIPFSDCHYWIGGLGRKNGYGTINVREKGNRDNRKQYKVHRLMYEFCKGPIGDKHVLHRCDNSQCVNPEHLFLGTHQDNMRDMALKGRTPFGSKNKDAKLKPEQVLEIRKLYAEGGHTTRSLGAKYGVNSKHIYNIVIGKKWKIVA